MKQSFEGVVEIKNEPNWTSYKVKYPNDVSTEFRVRLYTSRADIESAITIPNEAHELFGSAALRKLERHAKENWETKIVSVPVVLSEEREFFVGNGYRSDEGITLRKSII